MQLIPECEDLDPATRTAIIGAYRNALRVLDLRQPGESSEKRMTRVELISLVVNLAREGERDERRLGARAIYHALMRDTRRSTKPL
jgi:hypothetical protein